MIASNSSAKEPEFSSIAWELNCPTSSCPSVPSLSETLSPSLTAWPSSSGLFSEENWRRKPYWMSHRWQFFSCRRSLVISAYASPESTQVGNIAVTAITAVLVFFFTFAS